MMQWESFFIRVSYEKPSSSHCVMSYFWWGCRRSLNLITLGSGRFNWWDCVFVADNDPLIMCQITRARSGFRSELQVRSFSLHPHPNRSRAPARYLWDPIARSWFISNFPVPPLILPWSRRITVNTHLNTGDHRPAAHTAKPFQHFGPLFNQHWARKRKIHNCPSINFRPIQ